MENNDGVVYSTKSNFVNHEEKSRLEKISKNYQEAMSKEINEVFEDATRRLEEDYSTNLTHIHIDDFIECWEENLKELIFNGVDKVNEKTPGRTIYSLWEAETGSFRKGFVLIDETEDENGVRCFRQIYYTPSIAPLHTQHQETMDMNLQTIFGEIALYNNNKHNDKLISLTRDVYGKLNEIYDNKKTEETEQYVKFRNAWVKFFKFLDEYKENKYGIKPSTVKEEQPEVKEQLGNVAFQDDDLFDY